MDSDYIVNVIHDPLEDDGCFKADPSHALMTNIIDENDPMGETLGDLISQCVLERFPARP